MRCWLFSWYGEKRPLLKGNALVSMAERAKQSFRPAGRRCQFNEWVVTLDEDDQKTVWELLANLSWTIPALIDFFEEYGCPSKEKSITRHRKNQCQVCNVTKG